MYVCMYVFAYIHTFLHLLCMYVCMYVCMYLHTYMHERHIEAGTKHLRTTSQRDSTAIKSVAAKSAIKCVAVLSLSLYQV